MGLQASFSEISLTQFLYLVHTAHKTGAMYITRTDGSPRATLYMGGGQLLWASMQDHDGHLITLLHKAGYLSPKQAQFLHERGKGYTQKALALMLINANHINRNDVVRVVQHHIREIAFDAFHWTNDFFEFVQGTLPPEDTIEVPVDLMNIVLEGTRRFQETRQLIETVPDLDAQIRLSPNASERFQAANLTIEEWRLISMIGTRTTIRQLAQPLGMTDTETRRIIVKFMNAKLVEIGTPAPTSAWNNLPKTGPLRRILPS